MDREMLKHLNQNELILISLINEIVDIKKKEFSLIIQTFVDVKFSGCAFLSDILQLEALSIPILDILPLVRKETVTSVLDQLTVGYINFYELRKALDIFVASPK